MTWQPMPECNPGWQRNPDVEIVQVANYGSGERVGRCLPVGSFLCMAGGRDRSSYLRGWFDYGLMLGIISLYGDAKQTTMSQ